ncbi:hypothetical protein [Dactylosporangium darangshiense]|uniref:hypothetical protein n=1 Tax=Dactylosporangium darangshiense TaxID=579108 RepID=UPI0031E9D48F
MHTDAEHERLLTLYRRRVAGYAGVDDEFRRRWADWCRRLLGLGGELVVPPPRPDTDLDALLDGASPYGPAARCVPGDDNACHENVAVLWTDGAVAAVGTGYALSDDGLWRSHSWGVDADGTAVETTVERVAYHGIALTGVPALHFAVGNAGNHVKKVMRAPGPRARELMALLVEARRLATGA